MRSIVAFLLTGAAFLAPGLGLAQTYTVSPFAGGGLPVNIPGTSASLYGSTTQPNGLAVDKAGNVFFIDRNDVLRWDATTAVVTVVAGNGTSGYSGDNGPATSAKLNLPTAVAVDGAGNLYIAQPAVIRKVSNGIITTVAGNGAIGSSGDNGPATSATLSVFVTGVAVDSVGTLYIADFGNSRVRKVSNGVISTVAGTGSPGFSGDNGPATAAQLTPWAVAIDSAGNLYIADLFQRRVRKVSNGIIATVAGNGSPDDVGDNVSATSAGVYANGVAVDASGGLYISSGSTIRKIQNGIITTVAGQGSGALGDGGPALQATLSALGIAVDSTGNIIITDTLSTIIAETLSYYRIRRITNGVISTIVGNGTNGFSGDNGAATSAQLKTPFAVAVGSGSTVYIADTGNNRVRKVVNGVISTIAGNGSSGYVGDNITATFASLGDVYGLATDLAGSIYLADTTSNLIRKVTNGVITTVAGNGSEGFGGDGGLATKAALNYPYAVAVDSIGNVYVADAGNSRIRKISSGVITTVAGNGTQGVAGDSGLAINAQLNYPTGIAIDSAGALYIANSDRVRKVSNGVITTVAGGGGTAGPAADGGGATSAQLVPYGIAVDSGGNLFISEQTGDIRKVVNGIITTIADQSSLSTGAERYRALGIALDAAGRVYAADTSSYRVSLLTPSSACTYGVTPTNGQMPATGGALTVSIQTTSACAWTISGLPNWLTTPTLSGTGPAAVTLTAPVNTSGVPLSVTISVAGLSVAVTQPAAPTPGCTYTLSAGGQTFSAAGGSGTISVSAASTCSWSATSNASWVTTVGTASGTGNGTVTFQVAANSGNARSAVVSIAALAFTLEEGATGNGGLTITGSMAHMASAGSWTTTITLVNTGLVAAQARLNFFAENGTPLLLPWTLPQLNNSPGPTLASTFDRTLNPGAQVVLQTTGPSSQAVTVGWAQLLTNGSISGSAIFSAAIGGSVQDAVAPLETRTASGYVVPYDNTNGSATGVALANLSAQPVTVAVNVRDDNGAGILSASITIPAFGHTSFVLTTQYGSVVAQRRGSVEFRTPLPGQISVIGIRANATGAFSDIPPLAE